MHQYIRNSEARNVAGNFVWLTILQIAGYVFPLITLPYLAQVIGVDGFGKIAFAAAIIVYIQTITDWGFNYTATRDIANCRNNLKEVESTLSTITWARILLMILSSFVLLVCVAFIPVLKQNSTIILITLLLIPGNILFPEWLFQGMECMKYITILNFVSKLIFTCLIFVFIKTPEDYILQPLLLALGAFIAGILGQLFAWKKWEIRIKFVPFAEIIKAIKNSADVFINILMPNFYNSFSVIMIGFWSGSVATGYYDGGNKFNTIFAQFNSILSRAFFPFLARKIEKHYIYARLCLCTSALLSISAFILAPWLVHTFLTGAFDQSITVLRILSVSLFFMSMTSVYGSNYLIILHRERELRNITMIVSIIGFLIALPLVYYYSYIGAAVTITATRALLGCVVFFKARQNNQLN